MNGLDARLRPVRPGTDAYAPDNVVTDVERYYYDLDLDGKLSDDERDEDADGLSNWIESHGFMNPEWWATVYPKEKPFVVAYKGTDLADGDTDGDGIVDGADDADHDDIPNVREIRRQLVAGEPQGATPWVMGAPAGGNRLEPRAGGRARRRPARRPAAAGVGPAVQPLPAGLQLPHVRALPVAGRALRPVRR